jgi:hypothetical protein
MNRTAWMPKRLRPARATAAWAHAVGFAKGVLIAGIGVLLAWLLLG